MSVHTRTHINIIQRQLFINNLVFKIFYSGFHKFAIGISIFLFKPFELVFIIFIDFLKFFDKAVIFKTDFFILVHCVKKISTARFFGIYSHFIICDTAFSECIFIAVYDSICIAFNVISEFFGMGIICNLCIFNGFSGIFHFNGIFSGTCFNVIPCILKRICPSFKDFNGFFTVSAFKFTEGGFINSDSLVIHISSFIEFIKRSLFGFKEFYFFNPLVKSVTICNQPFFFIVIVILHYKSRNIRIIDILLLFLHFFLLFGDCIISFPVRFDSFCIRFGICVKKNFSFFLFYNIINRFFQFIVFLNLIVNKCVIRSENIIHSFKNSVDTFNILITDTPRSICKIIKFLCKF